MFVQHCRHRSSCRCDSPPVGLHLYYVAPCFPHVVAFSPVGFSLLGVVVGSDVEGMGEGGEAVGVANCETNAK